MATSGDCSTWSRRAESRAPQINADELNEKGEATGMLGKVAAITNADESRYEFKVVADAECAAFELDDPKEISLST